MTGWESLTLKCAECSHNLSLPTSNVLIVFGWLWGASQPEIRLMLAQWPK